MRNVLQTPLRPRRQSIFKLLEIESRNRIAPSVVQGLGRFLPKLDVNTGRTLEEEDVLTDPNPGTVMSFLTALFLLISSSDCLDVEDSGGCT